MRLAEITEFTSIVRRSIRWLCRAIRNFLVEEKRSGGAMVKGSDKKLKSLNFLGMLFTLKVMLQSLTMLNKTFQSGPINF